MEKDWLYNGREGETIGSGFFVFRRGKKTGRIGSKTSLPFEHPTRESAAKEARRLAEENPGETFEVFSSLKVSFKFDKK